MSMRLIAACILGSLIMGCEVRPEELHYGVDACHTCKMTLMDTKYGAEIVTEKGKVYKFDDINCMIDFYNSGSEPIDKMAYKLVINFTQPEKLIEAQDAFYVKSNQIRSPMASGIAAFETKAEMDAHKKEWKGIWLSWGELVTEFK
ncbi:MAG: nitrous oxide reductase accessory protein NosL [Cyclobacteriaceae bacterium]|nr:nitrous oxide reductase accessory protein NosL [Cyclobacteriaceae bacterium]